MTALFAVVIRTLRSFARGLALFDYTFSIYTRAVFNLTVDRAACQI
jgi:hypothetical protein